MTQKHSDINLKRIVENTEPIVVAGLSRNYLFGKPMDPSAQWQELGKHLGNIPGQKGDVAYGLCYDLDGGIGIEYVSGVAVSQNGTLPEGFVLKQLPSFSYAVFEHKGHVSRIGQTCDAIWKEWIPGSGYAKPEDANFFFERYGEKFNPATGEGDIEIWIPVES